VLGQVPTWVSQECRAPHQQSKRSLPPPPPFPSSLATRMFEQGDAMAGMFNSWMSQSSALPGVLVSRHSPQVAQRVCRVVCAASVSTGHSAGSSMKTQVFLNFLVFVEDIFVAQKVAKSPVCGSRIRFGAAVKGPYSARTARRVARHPKDLFVSHLASALDAKPAVGGWRALPLAHYRLGINCNPATEAWTERP